MKKFDSSGALAGEYSHGSTWSQGIAIDPDTSHVWIAHSPVAGTGAHLLPDGTSVSRVPVAGNRPTGVAIDRKGRVWVSSTSGVVQRINPLGGDGGADGVTPVGAVDLTLPNLGGPIWAYSNFVGKKTLPFAGTRGSWEGSFDWDRVIHLPMIFAGGLVIQRRVYGRCPRKRPQGASEAFRCLLPPVTRSSRAT